jgi:hypothetical protein
MFPFNPNSYGFYPPMFGPYPYGGVLPTPNNPMPINPFPTTEYFRPNYHWSPRPLFVQAPDVYDNLQQPQQQQQQQPQQPQQPQQIQQQLQELKKEVTDMKEQIDSLKKDKTHEKRDGK